ncbi:MAG: RagB/SusD family nutrient uptake outer membrane protein [Dysgonamonadaceae bacterium]|jgi:hypothetical protein|nr:RagB/SusD family nutrient uptake outer membrane protein [Dysgonamonadaceae bacterium]
MKHIIKNFVYLLIAVQVFVACEDILDQRNPNKLDTTNFWRNADDLNSGMNATYRSLRFNGTYRLWLNILYTGRSDEGYSESPAAAMKSYHTFLISNYTYEAVIFPWLDSYKGVFWANQVLDDAPRIDIDNVERDRIIGQATFIRGVNFFNIAAVYGRGGIPLSAEASVQLSIHEQADIYKQAQKDFETAANLLPEEWEDAKDLGRYTKGSALAMDVKVSAQLHEWDRVKTKCEEIFALGIYNLTPVYADNFTETNEYNSESLFEIAQSANSAQQLNSERAHFLGLPCDYGAWSDSFARNVIKIDLEKEKTTDGKTDPRLKSTLFYYSAETATEKYYTKTWDEWQLDRSKVFWKKFTGWEVTAPIGKDLNGINTRVVRLADIYLMYAEALNELTPGDAKIVEYINKVRTRVGIPNLENSTVFPGFEASGNSQASIRLQLMHERTTELAGENWRWCDLERWGCFEQENDDTANGKRGLSWLKSRDVEFNNFVIGKNNRFPIPSRDDVLVKGLDQNPGYN